MHRVGGSPPNWVAGSGNGLKDRIIQTVGELK